MLDRSSESASSVPVSPHVELMLQQMADRIAQLEAANHELTATVADGARGSPHEEGAEMKREDG
jgi:hypothetical protein